MSTIYKKINKILVEKDLSINKLATLIGEKNSGNLNFMMLGKKSFSRPLIQKLLPILEISKEEFQSWILADKYPKELLELAIQAKKDFPYKRKSILTTKIDAILHHAGMSRTDLSKQVKYSQSGLNSIITGKRSMSKPVLKKLSEALEIPENEILSWILADKYSLRVLELAYQCK